MVAAKERGEPGVEIFEVEGTGRARVAGIVHVDRRDRCPDTVRDEQHVIWPKRQRADRLDLGRSLLQSELGHRRSSLCVVISRLTDMDDSAALGLQVRWPRRSEAPPRA